MKFSALRNKGVKELAVRIFQAAELYVDISFVVSGIGILVTAGSSEKKIVAGLLTLSLGLFDIVQKVKLVADLIETYNICKEVEKNYPAIHTKISYGYLTVKCDKVKVAKITDNYSENKIQQAYKLLDKLFSNSSNLDYFKKNNNYFTELISSFYANERFIPVIELLTKDTITTEYREKMQEVLSIYEFNTLTVDKVSYLVITYNGTNSCTIARRVDSPVLADSQAVDKITAKLNIIKSI